ncbi:MAG: FHA domain-containing protein [Nostoc sp.]
MKVKISYSPNLSEVKEVDLSIETTPRGEWLIGRSPDSDLILDSPDISRVHGKFFVKGGNYYFCDLGSRNGSVFNGKEAEKDRSYSLSDGDVIRIADYVLILEAVTPAYEQAETVFRIIDPSLFSRSRSPENISTSNVGNPAPEVVKEVETPEINAPSPVISEISEVVSTHPDDVIPVVEIIAPENIIQSPEAVSKVTHDVRDEIVDLHTPVATEVNVDVDKVEVPEIGEASEVSLTEPDDAIAAPENIMETPEEESVLPEATHDEVADLEAALAAEATFVQRRDIRSAIPEITDDEDAELEAALEAEITFVQPRDIFSEVPAQSAIPETTHNEVVNLDTPVAEEVSADFDEVVSEVAEGVDIEEVSEVEATQSAQTPEEANVSEPPQTIVDRNIVLIAHESKKSELAEFVSQHQEFFSQSFTITWPSVSEVLHQQGGITISQQTPAPTSGGYQTIASLVGAGEILAVIFLRDLLQPQPSQANEEALLRLCNINQVLLATNLPTAKAIVHYLKQI